MQTILRAPLSLLLVSACATSTAEPAVDSDEPFVDAQLESGVTEGSRDARAILRVANGASATTLADAVGLYGPAVKNLVAYRAGNVIDTLAELDAIPYIGPVSYQALVDYATSLAWQDWLPPTFSYSLTVSLPAHTKTWSSLSQTDPNPGELGTPATVQLVLALSDDGTLARVRIGDAKRTTTIPLTGTGDFDLSFHESGITFDQRNIYDRRRILTGRIDARGEIVITAYEETNYSGNSIYGYKGTTTKLAAEAHVGLQFVDP